MVIKKNLPNDIDLDKAKDAIITRGNLSEIAIVMT
jgi:hypothetical protein